MVSLKRGLRGLLEQGDREGILARASGSRRVLGLLFSLTFDPDPLIAWRAVEAMGRVAARIADEDADYVRQHLRRLHWLLLEESGGIGWRAPEAMAEIVSRRPALFADYVPIVSHLIVEAAEEDLGHFRAGMLWAIGRLGRLAVKGESFAPAVLASLDHADPQIRGLAVWCLGRLGWREPLAARPDLGSDDGAVELFEGGTLLRTTVREVLSRALGEDPVAG